MAALDVNSIESAVHVAVQRHSCEWIARPAASVEHAQRQTTPLQIGIGAGGVAIDLHMHDHRARLLDLADSSKFHFVAEAGDELVTLRQRAQISAALPRQNEKQQKAGHGNSTHQRRRRPRERLGKALAGLAQLTRPHWRVCRRPFHLHGDQGYRGQRHE